MQIFAQIFPGKAKGDSGLQEPGLGTAVEPLTTEPVAVDRIVLLDVAGDGISELNFAPEPDLSWFRLRRTDGSRI